MKKLFCFALFATTICLTPHQTFAWSGAGHMVIAAEAYHELPEAARSKVDAVLKAHPDYAK